MKKSFLLYTDTLDILDEMSNEDAGLLFKAIAQYQRGEEPIIPESQKVIWVIFKNQFKRDGDKYNKFVEKQRVNGSKGGRPKKDEPNPNNPSVLLQTQNNPTLPKKADSVSDSDSDSDSDSENVSVNENVIDNVLESEIRDLMKYKKLNRTEAINYINSLPSINQIGVKNQTKTIFDTLHEI